MINIRFYSLICWLFAGVGVFAQVKTDRIRLTVEATHGAKTARLLEMRVYENVTPLVEKT